MTPLHMACKKGHAECAGLLLAGGPDLNAATQVCSSPMWLLS
jgi:ankyrin repeat protein